MSQDDRELDKELRFHLDSMIAANLAAGMSPPEARRQALLEFGGPEQIREEVRELRALHWLATLRADVRYGVRTLRASKAFTAGAVLSLALGIGANTAIFTLLHAALWKPLPVPRPVELYHLMRWNSESTRFGNSWVLFQQLRETLAPYGDLLARGSVGPHKFAVNHGQQERVIGEAVSSNYFQTLGLIPAAGRLMEPAADGEASPDPVLVLSHAFWARRFSADPGIIGSTVQYEERPFRIIGVTQPGFRGIDAGAASEVFVPIAAVDRGLIQGGAHTNWLDLLARLRPDAVPAQAEVAVRTRFRRHVTEEIMPDVTEPFLTSLKTQNVRLRPAASGFATDGREFERPLLVLMGVVGLVLLISCANVANLLLARNVARAREIAVRIALGAGRARLACQLLTESLLVALAGAALGIGLGVWSCRLIIGLLPPARVPLVFDLAPDATILAFTASLAVFTAMLCGMVPVWRAGRSGTVGLRDDGLRITGRNFAGRALVAGQLALSLTLVAGAGLFLKTLYNLASTDLGFRPEGVISFEFSYPRAMPAARRHATSRELLERLRARHGLLPTFAWPSVYSDGGWSNGLVALDGAWPPAGDSEVQAFAVGPEFFEALGIRLLAGRGIDRRDDASAAPVAVVNESFARKYFPDRSVAGHIVKMAGERESRREIVGLIADVRHMGVRGRVWPAIYVPALQRDGLEGTLLVRSSLAPQSLAHAVRSELKVIAPAVQIEQMATLNSVVGAMISREVLVGALSAAYGALAAFLAAMGLYGVMAYNMSRRTAEIGIRMALGARPDDIRRMALGEAFHLSATGLAIGIPTALAAGRLVSTLLYGMTAADPWVIGAAAALMTAVTIFAGWLPASRAARIDPNTALRRP
jgi:predicted permease